MVEHVPLCNMRHDGVGGLPQFRTYPSGCSRQLSDIAIVVIHELHDPPDTVARVILDRRMPKWPSTCRDSTKRRGIVDRWLGMSGEGQQGGQNEIAPSAARGSLVETISLPSGAMATAASLKFPRPSGIPTMVRQRIKPRNT